MNPYLLFILAALAFGWGLGAFALAKNISALKTPLPEEFQDVYDAGTYARTARYTRTLARVELIQDAFDTVVVAAFLLLGGFGLADAAARSPGLSAGPTGLIYVGGLALAADILHTPFSLYRTFVVEERFGFNRTTAKTFVLDRLKGYALAVVVGGPLLWAVLWFFQAFGRDAWLYAWGVLVAAMLAVQYIAPIWILPLFNTFTPLEDGELKNALERFAATQGFTLSGIFVVDGSRRSTKANAYFTGFGEKKRIALFDTLMERMEPEELTAVLAHEMGHCRRGHVFKGALLGAAQTGLLLFLLSRFLDAPGLYAACGVEHVSVYAGLVLFSLLYRPLALGMNIFANWLSRRFEYEADAYAAAAGRPEALVSALKKLSRANLSNLTPHPVYAALHYSHPPVLERIRALRRLRQ